jgi:uncharacterized protein YdgA (DUF945 family)
VKKGLVALVVLIVLYPAAAWLMGFSIEHRYDDFARQVGEQNPYFKISGQQFHRGWFASEQDLTVEPARGPFGGDTMHMTVHSVIHHGPICGAGCFGLAKIDSHLVFSPELQPYVTSIFGAAEPLTLSTHLGFLGGGNTHVTSPAIKDAAISDGRLSSDGLDLKSTFAGNLDSYSANAALPHVSYLTKDNKRFDLSDGKVDFDSKRALRTLYVGNSTVSLGQMVFSTPAGPGGFKITDMQVNSHAALTDGFLNADVKYGLASLAAGPVTFNDIKLYFTFRHLDADSVERLSAAYRESSRDTDTAMDQRAAKIVSAVKVPAIALFAKQPEISIDQISLMAGTGSISMNGLVKFQSLVAEDFDNSAGMAALLKKIDADLKVTIDDAFLTSVPGGAGSLARLDPLVKQGLASHENGKFQTTVGFHGGETTFNGKPFGLPGVQAK